jgi:hypothetical protein
MTQPFQKICPTNRGRRHDIVLLGGLEYSLLQLEDIPLQLRPGYVFPFHHRMFHTCFSYHCY